MKKILSLLFCMALSASIEIPVIEPGDEAKPVDITFPFFGKLTFNATKEGDQVKLTTQYPQENQTKSIGPITLKTGEFVIIGKDVEYNAPGTFFNQDAKINAKFTASDSTFAFAVDPEKKPTIKLMGKDFVLNNAKIIFDKSNPNMVKILANTNMFAKVFDLTFNVDRSTNTADLNAEVKDVKLKEFLPVGATPIANVPAEFTIVARNFTGKDQPLVVTIDGKADFTRASPDLVSTDSDGDEKKEDTPEETKLTEATIHGEFSKENIEFTANFNTLKLPVIGKVENPKIEVKYNASDKSKSVELIGNSNVTIPLIGSFPLELESTITNEGIKYAGKIKKDINFAGIKISESILNFNTKDKTIDIIGDSVMRDQKVKINLNRNESGEITVSGTFEENKPIKILGDFTLTPKTLKLVKTQSGYETHIIGILPLFNTQLEADVSFTTTGSVVASASAPTGFKLSDAIKELKSIGEVELSNLRFIITNTEITSDDATFHPGLNFVATSKLSGPLGWVGELTDSENAEIKVFGSIGPKPSFKAVLPQKLPFNIPNVEIGNFTLELSVAPPTFFLSTIATVHLVNNESLKFTTTASIGGITPGVTFSGTMEGVWEKPFGVSGVSLGNMALQFAIPLPPAVPTDIGVTGSLCLSGIMAKDSVHCRTSKGATAQTCGKPETTLCGDGIGACMAVKVPDLLSGEVDRFFLADVIKFVSKMMKAPFDVQKYVPEYGVECVKIYIAPNETQIGELKFEKGFNLTGKLKLLGAEAFLSSRLSESGFFADGYISRIEIPSGGQLLLISGTQGREKPEMKIEFGVKDSKLAFLFYLDGEVNLASLFRQTTRVDISTSGFNFLFESVFGNSTLKTKDGQPLLLASIKGTSASNPVDFTLEILFKQYLMQYLREQVDEKFNAAKNEVNAALGSAQQEINKIDGVIADADKKIKEAQNKVAQARESLNAINKAIDESNAAFNKAQEQVNSIQKEIDSLKKWYSCLPKVPGGAKQC